MDDNVLLLEVDTHLVATHFPATVSDLCEGAEVELRSSKSTFSHGENDCFPIFRVGDSTTNIH